METTDPIMLAAIRMTEPEADTADTDAQLEKATADQIDDTAIAADADIADEDVDQAETPDPEAPQRYTVKVDGSDVEVTLDELRQSFSGQKYIQKRMQEAAEARKQVDTLAATLQAEQQRFLEYAQYVQAQGIKAAPNPPNPAMVDKDPIGYMKAKARYDGEWAQYQGQQQQLQSMQAQQQRANDAAMEDFAIGQMQVLHERIPALANPETAEKTRRDLIRIGTEVYGFSDADIMGVTDARAIQVLHDATQWRNLQASTAAAKVAPAVAKTVVPTAIRSANQNPAKVKALAEAKRSGDLRAIAAAMTME